MKKKIRVALLFGGKSAEHEVSLQSARNVADAIDKNKYEVILIGIDKSGRWLLPDTSEFLTMPGRCSQFHQSELKLFPSIWWAAVATHHLKSLGKETQSCAWAFRPKSVPKITIRNGNFIKITPDEVDGSFEDARRRK